MKILRSIGVELLGLVFDDRILAGGIALSVALAWTLRQLTLPVSYACMALAIGVGLAVVVSALWKSRKSGHL